MQEIVYVKWFPQRLALPLSTNEDLFSLKLWASNSGAVLDWEPSPHLPVLEIYFKAWAFDVVCILMAILEITSFLSTASFLSELNALTFGNW